MAIVQVHQCDKCKRIPQPSEKIFVVEGNIHLTTNAAPQELGGLVGQNITHISESLDGNEIIKVESSTYCSQCFMHMMSEVFGRKRTRNSIIKGKKKMAQFDSLGDRMKRYETVPRLHLTRRTPVVIRLDGKAFHTFTRSCVKPYDSDLHDAMMWATEQLVEQIQGACLGYTQSDEISILLRDWDSFTTDAWYDYGVQKMVSIAAAICSVEFNAAYTKSNKPALFDARAFNMPKEEVCNYFIWRQQDATRNSINGLAQSLFSHKELQHKNVNEVQEMMIKHHGVNWNDLDVWKKRGSCVYRSGSEIGNVSDDEIPIFTEDREYVNRHLLLGE